jgi:CheY-like chemotaxis protein
LGVLLRKNGFRCTTTSSAAEAIAALDEGQCCAAIIDLHMPRTSGLDLLRALRDRSAYAELPVAIATADPLVDDTVIAEIERLNGIFHWGLTGAHDLCLLAAKLLHHACASCTRVNPPRICRSRRPTV